MAFTIQWKENTGSASVVKFTAASARLEAERLDAKGVKDLRIVTYGGPPFTLPAFVEIFDRSRGGRVAR